MSAFCENVAVSDCVRCEKKLPTSCLSDGTLETQKNWSKRHHRGKLLKIKVFFNREKFKIPARSLLGLVKKFCGDLKKKLIKVIKTNSVTLQSESNSLTPVRQVLTSDHKGTKFLYALPFRVNNRTLDEIAILEHNKILCINTSFSVA